MENDVINVKDQERILLLPTLNEHKLPAQLNWIQQVEGDYYLAGLTYIHQAGRDYDGSSTEWMLKLDKEVGFIPLFCTLYWLPK